MPLFDFRCGAGHVTEQLVTSSAAMPRTLTCVCGRKARRLPPVPYVIADMPDHFNAGLGRPIGSRRELREMQKRGQETIDSGGLGIVPEPFEGGVPEPPSDWV